LPYRILGPDDTAKIREIPAHSKVLKRIDGRSGVFVPACQLILQPGIEVNKDFIQFSWKPRFLFLKLPLESRSSRTGQFKKSMDDYCIGEPDSKRGHDLIAPGDLLLFSAAGTAHY
jgi:hypothetical protein